jgi:hypothetical protein
LPNRRPPAAAPGAVACPHLWQNWAPGVSVAWHRAQVEGPRVEPQLEQNFPVAWAPQRGQGEVVEDMGQK